MRLNTIKNCFFPSIPYSKPLREYKKPTFKIGDRVRISEYDLTLRKSYEPQFGRKVFEIVAIATKDHQHTQSRMNKAKLFKANFIKNLIKVI